MAVGNNVCVLVSVNLVWFYSEAQLSLGMILNRPPVPSDRRLGWLKFWAYIRKITFTLCIFLYRYLI